MQPFQHNQPIGFSPREVLELKQRYKQTGTEELSEKMTELETLLNDYASKNGPMSAEQRKTQQEFDLVRAEHQNRSGAVGYNTGY